MIPNPIRFVTDRETSIQSPPTHKLRCYSKLEIAQTSNPSNSTWLSLDPVRHRILQSTASDIYMYPLSYPIDNANIQSFKTRHSQRVTCVQWRLVDGGLFTSSGLDGKLFIYDTRTLTPVFCFTTHDPIPTHCMSHCSTHSLIAAATYSRTIRLCDLQSGAVTHSLRGHDAPVASLDWSPTHEFMLCSGDKQGSLKFWDIRKADSCIYSSTPSTRPVNALKFTHDGMLLATASHDNTIRLFSTMTGDERSDIRVSPNLIRNKSEFTVGMDITNYLDTNIPHLIYPSDDGNVLVFELGGGKLVDRLLGHLRGASCVGAFDSDEGLRLVSACASGPTVHWKPVDSNKLITDSRDYWSD